MQTPNKAVKFNSSYINMIACELRKDVRKACRKQGQQPMFGKNDFIFGISEDGHPYISVNYTIDGINQVSNCAI